MHPLRPLHLGHPPPPALAIKLILGLPLVRPVQRARSDDLHARVFLVGSEERGAAVGAEGAVDDRAAVVIVVVVYLDGVLAF